MNQILLVQPDLRLRRELRRLLAHHGIGVHNASSGAAALRALRSMPRPQLLVVEQDMPGMNGGDFLAVLERHPSFKSIPAVLISAAPDSVFALALRRMGLTVLHEPVSCTEVLWHALRHCRPVVDQRLQSQALQALTASLLERSWRRMKRAVTLVEQSHLLTAAMERSSERRHWRLHAGSGA